MGTWLYPCSIYDYSVSICFRRRAPWPLVWTDRTCVFSLFCIVFLKIWLNVLQFHDSHCNPESWFLLKIEGLVTLGSLIKTVPVAPCGRLTSLVLHGAHLLPSGWECPSPRLPSCEVTCQALVGFSNTCSHGASTQHPYPNSRYLLIYNLSFLFLFIF